VGAVHRRRNLLIGLLLALVVAGGIAALVQSLRATTAPNATPDGPLPMSGSLDTWPSVPRAPGAGAA
jgi:hypothetical protein